MLFDAGDNEGPGGDARDPVMNKILQKMESLERKIENSHETLEKQLSSFNASINACCPAGDKPRTVTAPTDKPTSPPSSNPYSNDVCTTPGDVKPHDCADIKKNGDSPVDGVYTVCVGPDRHPIQVYCDMTTEAGGWIVCITACFISQK